MNERELAVKSLITWVYTDSLNSTCDFYENGIGLEMVRAEGAARIFNAGSGGLIGVCKAFENRVVEPKGGMITLVTDDVDAWFSALQSKGIEVESPPHILEKFNIYTFFLKDPNGYSIEFQQFLPD